MAHGYTPKKIIEKLKDYFGARGFACEEYVERLGNIRLPLYCKTSDGDNGHEEIVVDIITDKEISKKTYLPDWIIQKATIENACSVKFFQYYFPEAKVYWAYGSYVNKDSGYAEFAEACKKEGIGLLEVSDTSVDEEVQALSLREIVDRDVNLEVAKVTDSPDLRARLADNLSFLITRLQQEYVFRLVYYGEPRFQRRQIIRRDQEFLSLLLIDKLQEIEKLQYHDNLAGLAKDYRKKAQDDYEIALELIRSLWSARFDLEYPDIHKHFEAVLLLDPRYRDHFLHQFQVFLLGALIIDKLYDTEPVRSFEQSTGSKLEDAWLAASTYHDFNYTIEKCDDWMTTFFEETLHVDLHVGELKAVELNLEGVILRDEFLSKMAGLSKALGCRLDDCFLRFVLGRVVVHANHGVLGALSFMKKFQNNGRLAEPAVNKAAASILLHDRPNWECFCNRLEGNSRYSWEEEFASQEVILQLGFDQSPLEFLLVFCDTVQEWGREGRDYLTVVRELENIQIDSERVFIHITMADDESYEKKRKELEGLKRYLKDDRFQVQVQSETGLHSVIPMSGI